MPTNVNPNNLNQVIGSLRREANKLSTDIKKWSASVKPTAEAKIKTLESKYNVVLKQLSLAQKDLNLELKRTIAIVKKHQTKISKTLSASKKAGARKTTKKAAKA